MLRTAFVLARTRISCTRRAFPRSNYQIRYLSNENENLKKTLNDMKNKFENKNNEGEPKKESEQPPQSSNENNAFGFLSKSVSFIVDNVKLAYKEMVGDDKESALSRSVQQAASFRPSKASTNESKEESEEEIERPTGPSAIVVVKEPKSAWESMKERLQDAPLIREILKGTQRIGQAAADTSIGKQAQNVQQNLQDKLHDAREFWETSQNPIIYTLSGVWDNITGETEEGIAVAAIKKLDPKFVKEEWSEEVRTKLVPVIIGAHLKGDTTTLKPWCGEAVFNKLAADIRTRKHDGIVFDSHILDIDENKMILKHMENGNPVIVCIYMVQQINCIRNREGVIVEGSETDVRAKFYSLAYQQSYDDEQEIVKWKIVDYEFAGDIPYY